MPSYGYVKKRIQEKEKSFVDTEYGKLSKEGLQAVQSGDVNTYTPKTQTEEKTLTKIKQAEEKERSLKNAQMISKAHNAFLSTAMQQFEKTQDKTVDEIRADKAKLEEEKNKTAEERVEEYISSKEPEKKDVKDLFKRKAEFGSSGSVTDRIIRKVTSGILGEIKEYVFSKMKSGTFDEKEDTNAFARFFIQSGANITLGELNMRHAENAKNLAKKPDRQNYNEWLQSKKDIEDFVSRNEKALDDENTVWSWLSKDFSQYLPQLKRQINTGATGAVIGGGIGAMTGGAIKTGAKIGYVIGSGKNSYDTMFGFAFNNMLENGADFESAKNLAEDEAKVSSAIEMGDAAFDIATFGMGKTAVKAGAKAVVKKIGGEAAKKAAKALIKEGSKGGIKQALKYVGLYAANILGEGTEESLQEIISLANERRIKRGETDTGIIGLLDNAFDVIDELGQNTESTARVWESGKSGMKIAAISGAPFAALNVATSGIKTTNSESNQDNLDSNLDNGLDNPVDLSNSLSDDELADVGITREVYENHTPQMKKTIADYARAVDTKLKEFVNYAINNPKDNKTAYQLGNVSDRAVNDIKNLTGIDTTGFGNEIKANSVNHINKRHGVNGIADNTMSNVDDIARIQYVVDNYDNVEVLNKTSKEHKNSNNEAAPMVQFTKRVDGTYYVVEAVPDTNRKKLEVVSAYKSKAVQQTVDAATNATPVPDVQNASADNAVNQAAQNVSDANIPRPHVQNEHSDTAYGNIDSAPDDSNIPRMYVQAAWNNAPDNSISQNEAVVNENLIKNISDTLRVDVSDEVIAALDKEYGGNGLRAFAEKLVNEYNATGSIGKWAEVFSDGGAKVMAALSGDVVQEQASDAVIDIDSIVNEAKGHAVGIIQDENTKALKPQEIKTFDTIAKALGVRVKFVPDLGGLANGFYKDGVICIALNAEMKYTAVFSHEITHRMKALGVKTYWEFEKLAVNVLAKRKGVKATDYISTLKKRYEGVGIEMKSPADVAEEVAADYAAMLFDDVDALNEFIALTEDKKHIRNLFYKAVQMLKDIIDKISIELTDKAFFAESANVQRVARELFSQMYGEAKGIAETGNVEDTGEKIRYSVEKSFSEQVNDVLNGKNRNRNHIYVGKTPSILKQVGLNDKPMLITEGHIKDIHHKKVNGISKYHGLSEETIVKLPYILDNPAIIFDSFSENNSDAICVLSEITDEDGLPILVVIKPDGTGLYNGVHIESNFVLTMFGKDNPQGFLNSIGNHIDSVLFVNKIRTQDLLRVGRLQLPSSFSKLKFNTIIHKSKNVVNSFSENNFDGVKFSVNLPEMDLQNASDGGIIEEELSKDEWNEFYRSLGEKNRGMWFPQTSDGEYIFETDDKLIFTDGDYTNPSITRIITFNGLDFEEIEYGKETIYREAQRGKTCEECCEIARYLLGHGVVTQTNFGSNKANWKRRNSKRKGRNSGEDNSGNEAKYSVNLDSYIDKYGLVPPGERPVRDVKVPKKISDTQVVSQFARTMMEAGVTPDDTVSEFEKAILDGTMTHEVITNDMAQKYAEKKITDEGYKGALEEWNILTKNDKVGKRELALGMQLYNQAVQNKDVATAMKVAADLVVEGTKAGQALQALRMLKLMTPDGKLYFLEKSVAKMNEEFRKKIGEKYKDITIDEEIARRFLITKDEEARQGFYDELCQHIADQIPSTLRDKWDSWRYLAMLGNPRTHIRNIIGNAAFMPAMAIKNFTGTVIEKAAIKAGKMDKGQATKSFKATTKSKEFAEKDFKVMKRVLQGISDKYAIVHDIEDKRTIYKSKAFAWLEKARQKNFEFLELEDMIFLKHHYKNALSKAITARNVDVDFLSSNTNEANEVLEQLRNYAVREAQAATYRDANALADALNVMQSKMRKSDKKLAKAGSVLIEGTMPFKKTPLNIAKQGVLYSPVGVLQGIYQISKELKAGKMISSDAINSLSRGLSGTMIVALGFFLKSMEWITDKDDEDKKKSKFDDMIGEQSYALKFGDHTYTIDWMAPSSLPLFVGVELAKIAEYGSADFGDMLDSLTKITDPLLELSCLQGISNTLKSASYSTTDALSAVMTQMAISYFTQAFPTLGGQIARSIDPTRRATYVDKESAFPIVVQRAVQQAMAKVPFATYILQPKIDMWGNDVTYGSLPERLIENFVSPGYYEHIDTTAVDDELKKLYEETKENAVFPPTVGKEFTNNKVTFKLTASEYTEFQRIKGKKCYENVKDVISSTTYAFASADEKVKLIKKCYDKAGDAAKDEMLKKMNALGLPGDGKEHIWYKGKIISE